MPQYYVGYQERIFGNQEACNIGFLRRHFLHCPWSASIQGYRETTSENIIIPFSPTEQPLKFNGLSCEV